LIASTDDKVIGKICPRSLPYRVGGMCEEERNKAEIYHTEEIQKKIQRILVEWNVRECFLDFRSW
jgi:hypothetical protein